MYKEELLQDIKGLAGVPVFGVLIVLSFLLNKFELAKELFVGLIAAHILTILIRALYFRRRPDKERYRTFIEKIDASSFPSLHSMRAGVLAAVLGVYFVNFWPVLLFILCAVAVAFSRVLSKRHYASDAVVGLILGFLIGWLAARFIS